MIRYLLLCALLFISSATYAANNGICIIRSEKGSCGSGFFVADNKVMTCWHVIQSNIEKGVRIRVEYDNKIAMAKVIDYCPYNDIALIECEMEGEKILELADSDPAVDEELTSRGHPGGKWDCHSCSAFMADMLILTHADESKTKRYRFRAHVREGMSGGPVMNKDGKVNAIISARNADFTESMNVTIEAMKKILKENS